MNVKHFVAIAMLLNTDFLIFCLIVHLELTKLSEEVTEFQLIRDKIIPEVCGMRLLYIKLNEDEEVEYYRQDVLWNYLSTLQSTDGPQMLSNIAKLILVIPLSNAEEESIFNG